MSKKIDKDKTINLILRILLLCAGVFIMAVGIAFSIKAGLGTSPISSLPYVTGEISGLTVGTTTIIVNVIFVLIQVAVLRKNFKPFQLVQIPVAVVFGLTIDLAELIIEPLEAPNYFVQWVFCALGIVLLAFGISLEIKANITTTAGEGVCLAVCQVTKLKFGNMKVIFDVSLVVLSCVFSLIFLHTVVGVREGTLAAALLVGQVTKLFNLLVNRKKQKTATANS